MTKNNRGAVDPVTWLIVGLLAIGAWSYTKVFEPGRNKKVADQIAIATDKANKEAEAAKLVAEDLRKAVAVAAAAHEREVATEKQMRENAAGFNGQNKAVLEADPAPSQYTLIAIGLCDSVDQSLGIQSTAAQRLEWAKRVVPLLQRNAEIEKELARKTAEAAALAASLKAEHEHALASDAHAATLASANSTNVQTIATTTAKAEKLAAENANWAAGALGLAGRFKAALIGLGVLAVIIGIIWVKLFGWKKTATDSVALGEYLKAEAIKAGHDAAGLEAKVKEWMQGDVKAQAAIDRVKSTLRL